MGKGKTTKKPQKPAGNGANLGFEQKLWAAADKLRGHTDAAEYVWDGDFRPDRRGGDSHATRARREGVQFSALECALDELNFARNRILHGGRLPELEWNVATLALEGEREACQTADAGRPNGVLGCSRGERAQGSSIRRRACSACYLREWHPDHRLLAGGF
jgi:hypothetical protein